MGKTEIAKNFAASFAQAAGGVSVKTFSSSIRFIAIMLVIIAMMWSINHFMDSEERAQDNFLLRMGSRLIRIAVGVCVFILCLIVKGS